MPRVPVGPVSWGGRGATWSGPGALGRDPRRRRGCYALPRGAEGPPTCLRGSWFSLQAGTRSADGTGTIMGVRPSAPRWRPKGHLGQRRGFPKTRQPSTVFGRDPLTGAPGRAVSLAHEAGSSSGLESRNPGASPSMFRLMVWPWVSPLSGLGLPRCEGPPSLPLLA